MGLISGLGRCPAEGWEMATHSSIPVWRIAWQRSLASDNPWGCRVRHDWMTRIFTFNLLLGAHLVSCFKQVDSRLRRASWLYFSPHTHPHWFLWHILLLELWALRIPIQVLLLKHCVILSHSRSLEFSLLTSNLFWLPRNRSQGPPSSQTYHRQAHCLPSYLPGSAGRQDANFSRHLTPSCRTISCHNMWELGISFGWRQVTNTESHTNYQVNLEWTPCDKWCCQFLFLEDYCLPWEYVSNE